MRTGYGTPIVMSSPVEKDSPRPRDVVRGPHSGPGQDGAGLGREKPAAAQQVDEHLASVRSPDSYEADQYRVLRHLLEQATSGQALRVLAVSSPAAGEGKTTTAINLAATLAQSPGARVIVVDADLRRPCVTPSLGLSGSNGPGLAGAILDAQLDLDDVVRPTPFGLSVLPAGSAARNPYSLLESPRVGELLQRLREAYDFVVVDTPPLLLVPDCRLISQWVDGFVIVVAADRTPRKLLAAALDVMDPAKVTGIVFNGDGRPLSGYYTGYYARYYGDRAQESGGSRLLSWWRRRQASRRHSWR